MSLYPIQTDALGMRWESDGAPAVAEVRLELAPGVNVVVDAAEPSTLTGWTVAHDADSGSLARACVELGISDILEPDDTEVQNECAAFHLDSAWTRRATTAAVERWWMSPIDEGALMLDEARARYDTGDEVGARRLVSYALPALTSLADEASNGELSGGALLELANSARAASAATAGSSWGHTVSSQVGRIEMVQQIDEAKLERFLEDLVDDASFGLVDVGMAGGPSIARAEVRRGHIDPCLLPPRILRWGGAHSPEWTAELGTQTSTDRVLLSVQLDSGVDPQCAEAGRILGFAADPSGRLIATIPMMAKGLQLVGSSSFDEAEFGTAVFGLFETDTPPRNLRLGPLAEPLIAIDRHMLDAWMLGRKANATLHAVNLVADKHVLNFARVAADGFTRDAVEAANRALSVSTSFAMTSEAATALAGLLAKRVVAIKAFVDRLNSRVDQPAGSQPLLAELVRSPMTAANE